LSSSASITVNITAPTGKPTVSITQPTDGYRAGANTNVSFSAAATASGSATITGYSWNFGDGSTGTGQNVTHNYPLNCTGEIPYQVTVTAADSNGATATDTITIYVGVSAC
jgi:chitinase